MPVNDQSVDELEDLVGTVLDGRYRLEQYINRGGFGVVYRGVDQKFNSQVAVKVGRSYREFMKEARLAAEVRHPNIVHVSDYGQDRGLSFIVMEFLEGHDLEALTKRADALQLNALLKKFVMEVGDALAHAHTVKLIHRDLKPRNIILKQSSIGDSASLVSGRFVLLDFGIAAKLDADGTQRNRTFDGAGTAEYMAPELLGSEPKTTHLSDIYAFGTILYQLMTGRVPFPQADGSHLALADCLSAIANQPVAPFSASAPDRHYPRELEQLVLQCLEKKPGDRPQSIGEVTERFLTSWSPQMGDGSSSPTLRTSAFETINSRNRSPQKKRLWLWRALGAVVLVGIIGFLTAPAGDRGKSLELLPKGNASLSTVRPEHSPQAMLTALVNGQLKLVHRESRLQLPAGSSITLQFNVAGLPPGQRIDFRTPVVPEAARIEMGAETDGTSQTYTLTIPDRRTPASSLPAITFKAGIEGIDSPVEATLLADIIPPEPWIAARGTLDPADAQLTANGQPVNVHDGHWEWSSLDPGTVKLRALKDGFETWETQIDQQGVSAIPVSLKPVVAMRLHGTITPSDASLSVNGSSLDIQDGHWTWSSAKAVTVVLKARHPGYEDSVKVFAESESSPVDIRLEKIPAIRLEGTLDPDDAELTINGLRVDTLGGRWLWSSPDPVDVHLKARRAGFAEWDRQISGQSRATIQIQLESSITFSPPEAIVKVNGRSVPSRNGTFSIALPAGAVASVVLSHQHRSREFKLNRQILAELGHSIELPPLPPRPRPLRGEFAAAEAKKSQADWSRFLEQDVSVTDSVGIEFQIIPPGEFVAGLSGSEAERINAIPARHAQISEPFFISATEISQVQWERVMHTRPWQAHNGYAGDQVAATYVSRDDATRFCEELTKLEQQADPQSAGVIHRLPTEMEWEWSCRAGSSGRFTSPEEQVDDFGRYTKKPGGKPAIPTVRTLNANAFGLFDVHGNVLEWCRDNLLAPGSDTPAIARGGSWKRNLESMSSAARVSLEPDVKSSEIGFRVVRERK